MLKKIVFSILTAFSFAQAGEADFPYSVAGLRWSRNIGHFSNGCVDTTSWSDMSQCHAQDGKHVLVSDDGEKLGSKAAQACLKIGGTLPTKEQYEQLILSFEHQRKCFPEFPEIVCLTKAGFDELTQAFGNEDLQRLFWTSTIGFYKDGAYVFNGEPFILVAPVPNVGGSTYRHVKYSVRCVLVP